MDLNRKAKLWRFLGAIIHLYGIKRKDGRRGSCWPESVQEVKLGRLLAYALRIGTNFLFFQLRPRTVDRRLRYDQRFRVGDGLGQRREQPNA